MVMMSAQARLTGIVCQQLDSYHCLYHCEGRDHSGDRCVTQHIPISLSVELADAVSRATISSRNRDTVLV